MIKKINSWDLAMNEIATIDKQNLLSNEVLNWAV